MRLKDFSFILIILVLGWVLQPAPASANTAEFSSSGYFSLDLETNYTCSFNFVVATPGPGVLSSYDYSGTIFDTKDVYIFDDYTDANIDCYSDLTGSCYFRLISSSEIYATDFVECHHQSNINTTVLFAIGLGIGILFVIFLMKVMT